MASTSPERRLRSAVTDASNALAAALAAADGVQTHPAVAGALRDYGRAVSALTADDDAHDRELIRAQLRLTPTERLAGIASRATAMGRLRSG